MFAQAAAAALFGYPLAQMARHNSDDLYEAHLASWVTKNDCKRIADQQVRADKIMREMGATSITIHANGDITAHF